MSQLARVPIFFVFLLASQILAAPVGNPFNISPDKTLIGATVLAVLTVVCFIVSCCVATGKQQDNPDLIE